MEKDLRSEVRQSKGNESSGSGKMEFFQQLLERFFLEGKFSWEKEGKRFLEHLASLFGFDCAGIWFWEGHGFQNVAGYGFPEGSEENLSLPDAPWWQERIKRRTPLFFSPGDISGEAQEVKGFFEGFHCAHFVLLPLWVQGKPWGLLLGGRKDVQKPWGEKERCEMEFLGRLLGNLEDASQMAQDFSQERTFLRLILEKMPDVIFFKDRQSRFLWTSSFHLQILGASRMEDVVGKTDFDFFPLEEAQAFYQDEQRAMETGEPIVNRLEKAHFHDGTVHWMLTTKVPVQDETGKVIGILGLARDITLFKEAEEELFLKRNFLLAIIEAMPDHIYVKDREHRFVLVNHSCARHLGFSSPEELLGKTDFDLHPPELAQRFWEEEERILKTHDAEINVEREADDFSTGTKRRIWILVHKVPVYDEHGQILGLLGINRDITERREMERALLFERNLLRSIIDTIPDHVYVKDLNHRFLLVNEADARHHGFSSPQEMIGKTDFDLHPPELAQRFWEEERMFATGETILNDERQVDDFSTGKKRKIWVSANKAPLYDERGKIVGMVGVSRDITERKEMEETLRESEQEKVLILNALQDQVTYYDADLRIVWVNRAVFDNFSLSPREIIGKHCYEVIEGRSTPCPGCAVVRSLQTGKPEEGEVTARNGTVWHQKAYPILDENGRVFRVVEISINITERKKAEERIRYLSFHDPLTGLYNRFFLQEELKRLDTKRQLPLSVIMGDVNNLKLVNDAFGHETGDELLKRMASILLRSCRREDLIARLGGDEFLMLLPQTPFAVAQEIVERIRRLCREESRGTGKYVPLSISLGYATKEREEENIQAVINEAESRMYRNKLVESRSARSVLITSLERSLWEISEETEAHSQRLRDIALRMGAMVGLPSSDLDVLELLARLHDLGKLGISRSILSKPGPLDEKEWEEVKRHPEIGYRIAQASPELLPVAEGILAHHERFDGSGYPQGLKGEEIPLLARIIAIVDAFDAMTSFRPYRKTLTREEALEEIKRNAGLQFDPHLVEVFLKVMDEGNAPGKAHEGPGKTKNPG